MIKKLMIGAGLAALAATAIAAPAMMGDGEMTRAEMTAKVKEHFAEMDKNKDGIIAKDELPTGGPEWASKDGKRFEMREHGMGDPNAAFDRIDANKDGSISRDEFAKGRQIRIEKRIVMREGKAEEAMTHDDHGEKAVAMMPHAHQIGHHRMGGWMFAMADSNGDGNVTLAEAEAMANKHFDQMDANKDGKVTKEERKAARPMMMKMHRVETSS